MNILLISYGIKEYDGRLKELNNVLSRIGDTEIVSCTIHKKIQDNNTVLIVDPKKHMNLITYFRFLLKCLNAAKRMKNIDLLFVDNLFASIPGHLIVKLYKVKIIVQDVRELYFIENHTSLTEKIFIYLESKFMKIANIVIAANDERAEIMKEHYKLIKKPMVYENLRVLDGNYDEEELNNKYKYLFNAKFNIVSTGGLSVKRTTDKLVEAMSKLSNKDYKLFIVGSGTEEDKNIITSIIKEKKIENIVLLGKVEMNELKYIVNQCDIGIVNYHQNDLNNQYCASGKIYEYLAEGLPIVTTENIPLMNFCNSTGTGEADNGFYKGIIKVSQNYDFYKEKVAIFLEQFSVEKNNEKLALKILEEYKRVNNGRI